MDPSPDSAQELFTLLVDRAQVLTYLFYGTALNGGGADNLGCPSDMLGNLPQRDPIFPDNDTGFFSFYQDFPGIRVEKNIGNT